MASEKSFPWVPVLSWGAIISGTIGLLWYGSQDQNTQAEADRRTGETLYKGARRLAEGERARKILMQNPALVRQSRSDRRSQG